MRSGVPTRFVAWWRPGRTGRVVASLLAVVLLAANGCQGNDEPSKRSPNGRSSAAPSGPLIAYALPKTTPWFHSGEVGFVLAQGTTPIVTWTKQVDASRFGGLGAPAFTTDGKYAFAQYADEQAGRYPYDGGDIHTELVWMDATSRQTHETPIEARSRTSFQKPGRPGAPYALQGSTVVWQAPASPDVADGHITLMQLDLGRPEAKPEILRTLQLPPRTPEQRAAPTRDQDFTGNVVGAGHGRVVIVKKYDDDAFTQADRLFLVDTDGALRDLGHVPTTYWLSATFSPDGTHFAYETGKKAESGACSQHQVTVFDSTTGHPAAGFPPGPFDVTPAPYFYGNLNGAVWWTADGKLRATGSADKCPTKTSAPTPDGGVWELTGSRWSQIAPAGTYRDYPLPNGEAAVIATKQQPGESPTATSLFIHKDGRLLHVADVEATAVAVAPGRS